MRPQALFYLTLAGLAACGPAAHSEPHSSASPAPLHACESREIRLDDTDIVLQANIDGTLGWITIVRAPDRDAQDAAIEHARKLFGDAHRDTRTLTHQSKWGILEMTDSCGRPVVPTPVPTARR